MKSVVVRKGLCRLLRCLVVGLAACAPIVPVRIAAPPTPRAVAEGTSLTEHVVVISVDGLRPDAIERFGAPTIQRLIRQGSSTLEARTILPSRTLPSHTSMLTGEVPREHGISWNSNLPEEGLVAVPTIFARAKEKGLTTAAFFSKGKFRHLLLPGSLDHVELPEGNDSWPAEQTVANLERYLSQQEPNLLFVHLREPDYAGHRFRWMSRLYGRAVQRADQAVARVLQAASEAFGAGNFTLILTADHGGSGWTHGSADPRDVTIPWVVWGAGVRSGTTVTDSVRTVDTAATALWLLGQPAPVEGRVVRSAFLPWLGVPAAAKPARTGPPAHLR